MFLSEDAILNIGFKSVGINVLISDKAVFYNSSNISIGNNVRIDDYCIISASGNVTIGDYIHIGCQSTLIGKGDIILSNFSNISSKVAIYSSNDDYSGLTMSNPMVNDKYKNVTHGKIFIGSHCIIGASSVILPNVTIGMGAVIGALSLVKDDCSQFGIYGGTPAKFLKERSYELLNIEKEFLNNQ